MTNDLQNNLKLIKNDTVVEILQQVRDFTDKNITWLNIRLDHLFFTHFRGLIN